jgi:hypothetical protein
VAIGLLFLWLILSVAVTYLLEVVLFAFGIGHLYDYIFYVNPNANQFLTSSPITRGL